MPYDTNVTPRIKIGFKNQVVYLNIKHPMIAINNNNVNRWLFTWCCCCLDSYWLWTFMPKGVTCKTFETSVLYRAITRLVAETPEIKTYFWFYIDVP